MSKPKDIRQVKELEENQWKKGPQREPIGERGRITSVTEK
jgi:hypothetical protein